MQECVEFSRLEKPFFFFPFFFFLLPLETFLLVQYFFITGTATVGRFFDLRTRRPEQNRIRCWADKYTHRLENFLSERTRDTMVLPLPERNSFSFQHQKDLNVLQAPILLAIDNCVSETTRWWSDWTIPYRHETLRTPKDICQIDHRPILKMPNVDQKSKSLRRIGAHGWMQGLWRMRETCNR